MLTLREDWRTVLGGAVAVDLLAQIHRDNLRQEAACHLVAASLDLLVASWPRGERPPLLIETVSIATWRISKLCYTFLAENDDAALARCIELGRSAELTVVVYGAHGFVKRELLTSVLGGRAPNVWELDSFISWRTFSATVDQGWPCGRALLELLGMYNRRVSAVGRGSSIEIQLCKSP